MTGLQVAWFVIVAVFVAATPSSTASTWASASSTAWSAGTASTARRSTTASAPCGTATRCGSSSSADWCSPSSRRSMPRRSAVSTWSSCWSSFGLILRSGALGPLLRASADRARWVLAFSGGSVVAGFFLGLIAGNLVRGLPLDANGDFAGGLGSLFNPFAIVVGLFTLAVFANQGAAWAALKTVGEAHALSRAMRLVDRVGLLALSPLVTLLAALLVPGARAGAHRPGARLGDDRAGLGRHRGASRCSGGADTTGGRSSGPAPRWWDGGHLGGRESSRRSCRRATTRS